MKDSHLSQWFSKNSWNVREAALLLYGFDPAQFDESVFGVNWVKPQHRKAILPDLSPEQYESMLHDLRCDLVYEVGDQRDAEESRLDPIRVAQWAWDVKDRFFFDQVVLKYICSPANNINYSDNSWIDRNYKKWADIDTWTIDEAADLLSGRCVGRDYELKSLHRNRLRENLRHRLERYALANRQDTANHQGEIYLPSKSCINWARSNGINIPPKLNEYFVVGSSVIPKEAGTNRKGCKNQIVAEFERRASDGRLARTWPDELKYLQNYAKSNHNQDYEIDSLRNIITKQMYDSRKAKHN